MYENFSWTRDTKSLPNLYTTYHAELTGVKSTSIWEERYYDAACFFEEGTFTKT